MKNSRTKGFTLIELIIVIAIIGVLAAILVPAMLGYLRNARISKANANAKSVHTMANGLLVSAGTQNITSSVLTASPAQASSANTGTIMVFGRPDVASAWSPSADAQIGTWKSGDGWTDFLGDGFMGYGAFDFTATTYSVHTATYSEQTAADTTHLGKGASGLSGQKSYLRAVPATPIWGEFPSK